MTNPFFEKYTTPHETAPFDKIKLKHFEPAFMEGMKRDKEDYFSLSDKVSTVFFNLLSAETNDDMEELSQKMQPILTKHENDITLNPQLFARVKAVYDQYHNSAEKPESPDRSSVAPVLSFVP